DVLVEVLAVRAALAEAGPTRREDPEVVLDAALELLRCFAAKRLEEVATGLRDAHLLLAQLDGDRDAERINLRGVAVPDALEVGVLDEVPVRSPVIEVARRCADAEIDAAIAGGTAHGRFLGEGVPFLAAVQAPETLLVRVLAVRL